MITLICKNCNKPFEREQSTGKNGKRKMFCGTECRYSYMRGSKHQNYKGGRYVPKSKEEYITILIDDERIRAKEHIVLMELSLGYRLTKENEVHHIDVDKHNNKLDNLYLCRDRKHHCNVEAATRRLKEFGSLSIKRCIICSTKKFISEFHNNKSNWDNVANICKICAKERARMYAK